MLLSDLVYIICSCSIVSRPYTRFFILRVNIIVVIALFQALQSGFLDFSNFDVEEYEHFEVCTA